MLIPIPKTKRFDQPSNCDRAAVVRRAGWLRRFAGRLMFELEVRRDLRHLQGFDDVRLRDIGLSRGGIEFELRKHGQC